MLLDGEQSLHHRYGADTACLYLVRPDGYVGFRSLPPQLERLQGYLDELFSKRG